MTDIRFLICENSKNIAMMLTNKKSETCCGGRLKDLPSGTTDAAKKKHVPVVEARDGKAYVAVGSIPHPMTPEHFIELIAIKTSEGMAVKKLTPDTEPSAVFALNDGETVEAAYAYCNLHSLWKS